MRQLPARECGTRWVAAAGVLGVVLVLAATVPTRTSVPSGDRERPWTAHIQAVDRALAQNDVGAATRASHDAYLAALGSWRWEGMVDVGDAYLRIGEVAELRPAVQAKARNAYLAGLFRARQHESFEGLLRVAEAYAALGDRDVAEQCLRIAGPLAARSHDPAGYTRVKALQDGLSAQVVGTERL